MVVVGLFVLLSGCGADQAVVMQVEGAVSQVTGTDTVDAFVVVDDDGVSHAFVPAPGLRCDGEPLTHLRTHLIERDRVRVTYESSASGRRVAVTIDHLDG